MYLLQQVKRLHFSTDSISMRQNGTDLIFINTAITVAAISFFAYIVAGFVQNWMIVLPVFAVVTVLVLFAIRAVQNRKVK